MDSTWQVLGGNSVLFLKGLISRSVSATIFADTGAKKETFENRFRFFSKISSYESLCGSM